MKGNLQLAYENPLTIASHNGNEILLNRQYLIPIRQVVRLLYGENLTTNIVNECAKRYFTPQRMSVFMAGADIELVNIEEIFTDTFGKPQNISFKSFIKTEMRSLDGQEILQMGLPTTPGEAIPAGVNVEQITKSIQSLKINQLNSDLAEINKLLEDTTKFDLSKLQELEKILAELPVDQDASSKDDDDDEDAEEEKESESGPDVVNKVAVNSAIKGLKQKISSFKSIPAVQVGGAISDDITKIINDLKISELELLNSRLNEFLTKGFEPTQNKPVQRGRRHSQVRYSQGKQYQQRDISAFLLKDVKSAKVRNTIDAIVIKYSERDTNWRKDFNTNLQEVSGFVGKALQKAKDLEQKIQPLREQAQKAQKILEHFAKENSINLRPVKENNKELFKQIGSLQTELSRSKDVSTN